MKMSAIERRFAGIADHFRAHGLTSPTASAEWKAFMGVCSQCFGEQPKRTKALTKELLTLVLQAFNLATLRGCRNYAIFLTCYELAHRAAELVAYNDHEHRRCRIEWRKGGLIATVPRKNARGSGFAAMSIPYREDKRFCAPTAIRRWLDVSGLQSGPVFRKIDMWDHIGTRALRPKAITWIVRKVLSDFGIPDAQFYSGHSFRRGHVTDGILAGWTIPEIMQSAGFASESSITAYIDIVDPFYRVPESLLELSFK
jgi:integrase